MQTLDEHAPATAVVGQLPAEQRQRFEAFVRAHETLLLGWLRVRAAGDDSADVAQDTWLRLMRYAAQPDHNLKLLMFRIAQNVLLDRGRAAQTHAQSLHVTLDDAQALLASREPEHVERVDTQRQLDVVRKTIDALPPRCREVYLLNRVQEMSYQAIARDRAISVKTVEKHISTALRMLRQSLDAGGDR